MISSIVDGNGFLVYTGNDVNEKFATVLAIEGHSRIDVNSPDLEKIKWDGTKWIKGETDLEAWEKKMARSDGPLPRWGEDLVDGVISSQTQKLADDKKALRSEKP